MTALSSLEEDDLFQIFDQVKYWGTSFMGDYNFALWYTAHHQGQLAGLASHHGHMEVVGIYELPYSTREIRDLYRS